MNIILYEKLFPKIRTLALFSSTYLPLSIYKSDVKKITMADPNRFAVT